MYPRIKKIYEPIVKINNTIHIYCINSELELIDETGDIKNLLDKFDGTMTIEEISRISNFSIEDINEFIENLDEYGIIENAFCENILSLDERERYKSNLNYFLHFSNLKQSSYSIQKKLLNSTVLVLGLGGSSIVTANFAGMGVKKIIGIDYDTVELGNLSRQFLFEEKDIGRLKTNVTKERVNKINSNTETLFINKKIVNSQQLLPLIKESDVVLNGIDQPTILATRWVNKACVDSKKVFVQGGVGDNKIMMQMFNSEGSGCFDCYLIKAMRDYPDFYKFLKKSYGVSFSDRNTAFAPNITFLGGMLSKEVFNILVSTNSSTQSSYTLEFDAISMEKENYFEWDKEDECPTCGKNKIKDLVDIDALHNIACKGR